jgi:hypothetical protein
MQETTRNALLYVLPCVGARLELYQDRVRILHPGWLTFVQTDHCFPLTAVQSVVIDSMNPFLSMMRFQIDCHDATKVRDVIFQRKYEALAREIKKRVDQHIDNRDVLALIHEQFATAGTA